MPDMRQESTNKTKEQLRIFGLFFISFGIVYLFWKSNYDLTDRINFLATWIVILTSYILFLLNNLTKKIEAIESILKKNNSQDAPEKKDIGNSGDAIPNSKK